MTKSRKRPLNRNGDNENDKKELNLAPGANNYSSEANSQKITVKEVYVVPKELQGLLSDCTL